MNANRILLALLLTLTACDRGSGAVEIIGCAIEDEKLSVAFRDPVKAKAYLDLLGKRLKEQEAGAITEAADLVERVSACLK